MPSPAVSAGSSCCWSKLSYRYRVVYCTVCTVYTVLSLACVPLYTCVLYCTRYPHFNYLCTRGHIVMFRICRSMLCRSRVRISKVRAISLPAFKWRRRAPPEHGDDRSVQLFAVATTVFVLVFLYMAKKLRDRNRAHDGGEAGGVRSSTPQTSGPTKEGGDDSSPPRLHKHRSVADVVELVIYPIKSCAGVSWPTSCNSQRLDFGEIGYGWWSPCTDKAAHLDDCSPPSATPDTQRARRCATSSLLQRECPRMALVQPKIRSTTC